MARKKIMPHALISFVTPYLPAVLSGFLLTAGFPDSGLWGLMFFALVPAWVGLESLTPRQGFYNGLTLGLVHYLTLVYWLVPTLTTYGGIHLILAISSLVLLSLYLALYPALFCYLMKRYSVSLRLNPLWGGLLWTGLEYIRTHAFTGFPWGVLGYSQSANLLMVQMADITGVLGISFVLVAVNGSLAQFWLYLRQNSSGRLKMSKIEGLAPLGYGTVILLLVLGYGSLRLDRIEGQVETAKRPNISVAQGSIEQSKKWDKAFKQYTVDRYGQLSLKAEKPDLVIWPETALPFYYGRDPLFSSQVDEIVRKTRSPFLIGSPAAEFIGEKLHYYNRAYMLNPLALVTGRYDKTHLVPFGEYVPLEKFLFFLEKITSEAGNFSPGTTGFVPLAFKEHKTGVLICFEILFPDIARQFVLNGADILTTITNDAWFGRTSAPAQHFAVAVLRAVENRRSLVRAANTGISGFISPTGRVMARTELFTFTGLSRQVPALTDLSIYTRHGDMVEMAALVAILLVFMVKGIKHHLGEPET